ncbi:hypothetical protein ROTAS13_01788 [Roseomonas sp. TAS13]|nr:hypothetical protein ROTAS13_01788 [Roseomonas sp. TAS13]
MARTPPAQSRQSRNQARAFASSSSQSSRPIPRKAAVYFDSSAAPAKRPTASHQRPSPRAWASATAQRVRHQKTICGVSGVISTAPAFTSSVALNSEAAITPGRRSGNRRLPARTRASVASSSPTGPSSRMPSGVSPSSSVPARIQKATMGGWS